MNDLKSILKLMILATENVMLPVFDLNSKYITCRIGAGKKTCVRQKIKNSCYHYSITYGIKMLESKQVKMKALSWTSGREIIAREYFLNPTFKNMIVACILHEFAHVIQFRTESSSYNSVHNDLFYSILDNFYERELDTRLDEYLSQFKEYNNAEYTNVDVQKSREDLKGAKYLKIRTKTSHMFISVEKLNPKKVKGYSRFGEEMDINYMFVLDCYKSLEDIEDKKVIEDFKKERFNKKNMVDAKYIKVLFEGKMQKFKIIKLNPKKVKAEPLEDDGYYYNFSYSRINAIS